LLDLGSGSLESLGKKDTEIFVFDHHEVPGITGQNIGTSDNSDKNSQSHEIPKDTKIPDNVNLIHPLLSNTDLLSSAGICYEFAKSLSEKNKDLASLAILGMVGDQMEKNVNPTYQKIIQEAESTIKKGLLIYPSTRPLDKALEYSSNPYIPEVTGSYQGSIALLNEADIKKENGKYKSLHELTEEEMSRLITAVMLRCDQTSHEEMIGNLYLIKWFNKLEDARELSALVNACSRTGSPEKALCFCLGNKKAKEESERIYVEYKQHLISALKHVSNMDKVTGKKYTIINAQDNIKDTIIGTVASIISNSPTYKKGTAIIALAYNENKIKVSARIAGKEGRNIREVLHKVVVPLGGDVGGHPLAAGCMISKDHEETFLEELKKNLETDTIKIQK
jgi:RecJ-like exonuclease